MLPVLLLAALAPSQDPGPSVPRVEPPVSVVDDDPQRGFGGPARPGARGIGLQVRTGGSFAPDRDAFGGAVLREGVDLSYSRALAGGTRLSVSFDAEHTGYDLDAPLAGLGRSLDDTWRLELGASAVRRFDERWGGFASVGVTQGYEEGAAGADAWTAGLVAGASYTVSEDLTWSVGLLARTELEESPEAFPIVGVTWRITDRWLLDTRDPIARLPAGPAVAVSYELDDAWRAFAATGWVTRDTRLDGGGPAGGGVLRDEQLPLGLGLAWDPNPGVRVVLFGGALLVDRVELDDASGDPLFSESGDPSPFLALVARLRF